MKICIFEDDKYKLLYPLSLTRPVFDLKCGYFTLRERISGNFSEDICYLLRDYLVPFAQKKLPKAVFNDPDFLKSDDILFINGRWLLGKGELCLEGEEEVGVYNDTILYVRTKKETIQSHFSSQFKFKTLLFSLNQIEQKLPHKEFNNVTLITYPWDLVNNNSKILCEDFEYTGKKGIQGSFSPQAAIYGDESKIFIAKSAQIHPFVVLDTTEGPIYIDEEAVIYPHTRIEGPSYIGKATHIFQANIKQGVSLGPICRVGGEVEESIIHGFSNKFHTGFLGHSYVGEWVNLGAMSTTSDIKNDFSSVQVYIEGELRDSKQIKVGSFIGDHSKIGIGCLLNTGTVVGVGAIVVPSGEVLPKFIPSFVWYLKGKFYKGYGFGKIIEGTKEQMKRRNMEMSEEEYELLREVFELTKEERNQLIAKSRR
ncbi:hypothetical protein J7M02_07400 [Candidatus Aerophobetes bacterium]|nr:hypothetical protein [Candidatus Aerophobetes bacterium]